ncbi:hypothetical protein BYT27DRAFT_7119416 [Phlegmacium glaucopus]|nr:hypothetical protein BYT27DRAFT_7119416 [Phlegmacium glaucopus]
MDSGVITLKDQLHEYMFHRKEMIEMSLFTFVLDTYDGKINRDDNADDSSRPIGIPPNRCVQY